MILSILLATACGAPAELPASVALEPALTWTAPSTFMAGESFPVEVVVTAAAGDKIPMSWLGPEGFTVNKKAVGRAKGEFDVTFDIEWSLKFDLSPSLTETKSFTLGHSGSSSSVEVGVLTPAPEGLDFMSMDAEEIAKYGVLMRTNRGDMLIEFWPETAPNHCRSFLDLAYASFYDGILFHRCIPGFMVQSGDPKTKDPDADPRTYGTGGGPRKLDAEFSDRPHERGTLSAARLGGDVNSATSQFFLCHQRAASLDRQYTAFGQLRYGHEVIDLIVNSPKAANPGSPRPTDRPRDPQVIERAIVVVLPK
ncbi:MAG: peptidyl-prolyl cis-trans isomerase B (cyclophilin B) [Planctomycetota bacterium]|jgi:peptidyl-prolyl cis-trans isomerase B (cyclophilin B)